MSAPEPMTDERLAEIRTAHAAYEEFAQLPFAQMLDHLSRSDVATPATLHRHRHELLAEVDRLTAERDEALAEPWSARARKAIDNALAGCRQLTVERDAARAELAALPGQLTQMAFQLEEQAAIADRPGQLMVLESLAGQLHSIVTRLVNDPPPASPDAVTTEGAT